MSPLFHISTIHSFLWSVIRPFRSDIAAWVTSRIEQKIADRKEHRDRKGTRANTKIRLEQEIAELEDNLAAVGRIEQFTYGTGE